MFERHISCCHASHASFLCAALLHGHEHTRHQLPWVVLTVTYPWKSLRHEPVPMNTTNEEEQKNEIEALRAIYWVRFHLHQLRRYSRARWWLQDAFQLLSKPGPWNTVQFKIDLTATINQSDAENYCSASLRVQYNADYPSKLPPLFTLEKVKGLSKEQTKELRSRIDEKVFLSCLLTRSCICLIVFSFLSQAKEMTGSVMVYDVAQLVQEYLQEHNQKPVSFYEEMIMRQQSEKEAEEAAARKKREEALQKDVRERAALDQLIKEELKRQEALSSSGSESPSAAATGSFTPSLEAAEADSLPEDLELPPEPEDIALDEEDPEHTFSLPSGSDDFSLTRRGPVDAVLSPSTPLKLQEKAKRANKLPPPVPAGTSPNVMRYQKHGEIERTPLGSVYFAEMDTGRMVVVKEMLFSSGSLSMKRDHIVEVARQIESLKTLQHESIVQFLGTEMEETSTSFIFRIFQQYVPGTVIFTAPLSMSLSLSLFSFSAFFSFFPLLFRSAFSFS